MNIQIAPLPFLFWLPYVFILYIFLINYKKNRLWFWAFPIILLFILLQLKINIPYFKDSFKQVYLNTNQSMLFTDLKQLKQTFQGIKQKTSIKRIFDFNSKPYLESNLSHLSLFQNSLSTFTQEVTNEENIVLTNLIDEEAKNSFFIPVDEDRIQGIFNAELPEYCYENKICVFKFWLKTKEKQKVSFFINHKMMEQINIDKNHLGWVTFKKKFVQKDVGSNLVGRVQLHREQEKPKNYFEDMPFIISVKRQLPIGYLYVSEINFLSWRLSHYVKKVPYWNLQKKETLTNTKEADFFLIIGAGHTNRLLKKLDFANKPIFYYISSNDTYQYTMNNWEEISKSIYKVKNKLSTFFFIVKNRENKKNIFFEIPNIQNMLQLLSEKLQLSNPPLQGGYVQASSSIEVYDTNSLDMEYSLISNFTDFIKGNPVKNKRFLIQKNIDHVSKQFFFHIPNIGHYFYGSFNFPVSIPMTQRIKVYNYLNFKNRQIRSNITSKIEILKQNISKVSIPSKFVVSLALTPYILEKEWMGTKLVYIFFFIFFLLCIWYFPTLKED